MTNDRVHEAIVAAAARHDALTATQKAECAMMLLLGTHLLRCCPIEPIDDGKHHVWHRELLPPINGEGCRCKGVPMTYYGPEHFLAEKERAA